MKIVGVGCGPDMITREAISIIRTARCIAGSRRAIELASGYISKNCKTIVITDFRNLGDIPENAIVLSTGDPMLAGLGFLEGTVIPGISSLQVACARLRIPISRVVVISAHGRDHERAVLMAAEEVQRGKIAFLAADPAFDISSLAKAIAAVAPSSSIAVCERLGYPDEQIIISTVTSPPAAQSTLFVLLAGAFSE